MLHNHQEVADALLKRLEKVGPQGTAELAAACGYTKDLTLTVLNELVVAKKITNKRKCIQGGQVSIYFLASESFRETADEIKAKVAKGKETFGTPINAPFFQLNGQVGWNRVFALKRMKARLIDDFHPLIDLVIADYEYILNVSSDGE